MWCAITCFLLSVVLLVLVRPEFVFRDVDVTRLCPNISVNTLSIIGVSIGVSSMSLLVLVSIAFVRSRKAL